MKIKAIKLPIPTSDSYKGLHPEDWVKLNNRKSIKIDKIPRELKDYVEIVEEKHKKEVKNHGS